MTFDVWNVLSYAIFGSFVNLFYIVSCHKLLDKKIDWKNYKVYLVLFLATFFGTLINFFLPHYLKIFLTTIMISLLCYIFFCKDIARTVVAVIMTDLVLMISELLIVIITSLIGLDMYAISITNLGIFWINIGTTLLAFLFLKFKFLNSVFDYLIKTFNNMKKSNLLIYFLLSILLASIFMIMSYMNAPYIALLITNTILIIFYMVMLFRLANARENYRQINSKYETSIHSLKEYEDMMDKYKVANHENKNQLLAIRNMLKAKDKKTVNYIDKLVDDKIKDNETIFYQTSKIPEGGLRATIYSKLCKMDDMKIKYQLDIANDVRAVDLIKIGDYTNLNICKIIGVFLDNSIEAVTKLKNKLIILEIFVMDNKLYLDISNSYKGQIELDKISNKKYTTKGKGRGYGLALVDDLIKKDSNLEHEMKISKELFTQRLKIKM